MNGSSASSKAQHKAWKENIFDHAKPLSLVVVQAPQFGPEKTRLILAQKGPKMWTVIVLDEYTIGKFVEGASVSMMKSIRREEFIAPSFHILEPPPLEKEG